MKALVTGGASGIGKAVVARLRLDGVSVVSADIATNAEHHLDVTKSDRVSEFVNDHGSFDVVVTCAADAGPRNKIQEISNRDWERTFETNAFGTFNILRAVLPGMVHKRWGRIVCLSSQAANKGFEFQGAYAASKGAVEGLVRTLAKELAGTGVLANIVSPTLTTTPMIADLSQATQDAAAKRIPLGRAGTVTEAAELISWLASEKMTFSTGAVFDFSGGRGIL